MDTHWLTAPEREVAAAMAAMRLDSRPGWVPTKRKVLVHVNHCLMLWYLCIVWLMLGVRIDTVQNGAFFARDIRDIAVTTVIFLLWGFGTFWLYRWAAKPPLRRSRTGEWRRTLTALANGFESEPIRYRTFESLITDGASELVCSPRFAASGVEFGRLSNTNALTHRTVEWEYAAVKLSAPLPHFVCDAVGPRNRKNDLPFGAHPEQRLSLEGDFDRWFHLYAPRRYERDALFVFTPDVMAALIDTAQAYNIEIVDDTLVCFRAAHTDFLTPAPWERIGAILSRAVPLVVANADRYRDERVPEQNTLRTTAAIRASLEHPGEVWRPPAPRIGPDGRRLEVGALHRGVWRVLGAIGWFGLLVFLYAVPGLFAFAGFMSVIDKY